jgi:hypothetical protein
MKEIMFSFVNDGVASVHDHAVCNCQTKDEEWIFNTARRGEERSASTADRGAHSDVQAGRNGKGGLVHDE